MHRVPYKKLIAALFVLLLVTSGFLVWNNRKSDVSQIPLTPAQLFIKELNTIDTEVNQLEAYLRQPPSSIETDLDQYIDGMQNLQNPCQQIQLYVERYKQSDATNAFKDSVSQAGQLCNDYVLVLRYSGATYTALYPYMNADTQSLQTPEVEQLKRLKATIDKTKESFKSVNAKGVEDPARNEILVQIELAEKTAQSALSLVEAGDNVAAQNKVKELTTLVEQDKVDFINARSYFWRNTVRIKALQKSVRAQIGQFESLP